MTDEGFTVFNDRELKLLKLYMGHHGWPKDNLTFARTVEYKCNLLDSSGNEGKKT